MDKKKLEDIALKIAEFGRDTLADCIREGRDFIPTVFLLDVNGGIHIASILGEAHGSVMAQIIRDLVSKIGIGVEAIITQADARYKVATPEEWAKRVPSTTDIAMDPKNAECLMTQARSRENTLFLTCMYTRKVIGGVEQPIFDTPEPQIDSKRAKIEMFSMPNIWETVN